jgi:hypothetical protein
MWILFWLAEKRRERMDGTNVVSSMPGKEEEVSTILSTAKGRQYAPYKKQLMKRAINRAVWACTSAMVDEEGARGR